MVTVLIVDDHAVVVKGIRALLQNETGIAVVGTSNTATDCLAYFETHTADVVPMDINLPDMNVLNCASL